MTTWFLMKAVHFAGLTLAIGHGFPTQDACGAALKQEWDRTARFAQQGDALADNTVLFCAQGVENPDGSVTVTFGKEYRDGAGPR